MAVTATEPRNAQEREWSEFLAELKRRVAAGDADIPIGDFNRYRQMVGDRGEMVLHQQWNEAKKRRALRDLIAVAQIPHTDAIGALHQTNRLLAAILEKLHAADD